MTDQERQLLFETVLELKRLSKERDDMIVATAAIMLDLYRRGFASGDQTKEDALAHLRVQLVKIEAHPSQSGAAYLRSIIRTLDEDCLDTAKLLHASPARAG